MKQILMLITVLIVGCNTVSNNDYEANKMLAEKWVKAFETNNLNLWKEVVSEDLTDIAPLYGMGQVDYEQSLQIAEFYVGNYINVKFNDAIWLPGIDQNTLKPDGSVRAYGSWTGESISSGRTFKDIQFQPAIRSMERSTLYCTVNACGATIEPTISLIAKCIVPYKYMSMKICLCMRMRCEI